MTRREDEQETASRTPEPGGLDLITAGDGAADWEPAGASGGALHRSLVLLEGVASSHLIHERVIDENVSAAFRDALREPSVASSSRLLATLITGRKVRSADLLGIVPQESSRARGLAQELRELVVATWEESRAAAVSGAASGSELPAVPSADLLAEFLRRSFAGEIRAGAPDEGPRALAAAANPGPDPEDGMGMFLVRSDGSRQPLHPFVIRSEGGEPLLLWRFAQGRLEYRRASGGFLVAMPATFHADFFVDFFLKMGAYEEAREWLRSMTSEERSRLNRRNILYAGFCHYGNVYLRQGEFQQAAVELEKAVKIRPDLVLAHLHLAQAYISLKQLDRAVDILKKHAVLYNRSDRIFELIGDCYRQKKELGTALRMYEKAVDLNALNRQVERKRDLLREESKKDRDEQARSGGQPAVKLEEFLVDMNLEAELGSYHSTVGREPEIRQLVEILSCRDKRNALILSDPGVGKTALVEDFVLRLAQRRLPRSLRGRKVYLMSVATLLAGAKFRGQFEERVLELIKALKHEDCVLFIDNIHLIVSSGLTRGGAMDTSNLLKPYLLRGEIQVIGATTHEDYRQGMEKDASLTRCFQTLTLEEPSAEEAVDMVRHVKGRYESHHRVVLPDAVIRQTLPVIDRCLRERALPDKALDVYDRAAAVASIRRSEAGDRAPERVELRADDVLEVLSEMTRIPVARLGEEGRSQFAHLEEALARRVVGQQDAVQRVARVVRAARTGMRLDARRPKGIFLFVGPTGVGKTELARATAEALFGSDERLIRIDMSEYMERINQSRLIGTAPGYVGYNDQNQLTDEVRKSPHSVVLLDEIEKADLSMLNLFLQVFDAGRLTDGKGRTVHFDNTTIIMTSNVGTQLFSQSAVGFEEGRGQRRTVAAGDLLREVQRHFTPEFLNRIDEIVCFSALSTGDVRTITRNVTSRFAAEMARGGRRLELLPEAEALIAEEGHSFDQGARNLERTIRRLVLEPLAERAVGDDWDDCRLVRIGAEGGRLTFQLLEGDPEGEEELDLAAELPLEDASDEHPTR